MGGLEEKKGIRDKRTKEQRNKTKKNKRITEHQNRTTSTTNKIQIKIKTFQLSLVNSLLTDVFLKVGIDFSLSFVILKGC